MKAWIKIKKKHKNLPLSTKRKQFLFKKPWLSGKDRRRAIKFAAFRQQIVRRLKFPIITHAAVIRIQAQQRLAKGLLRRDLLLNLKKKIKFSKNNSKVIENINDSSGKKENFKNIKTKILSTLKKCLLSYKKSRLKVKKLKRYRAKKKFGFLKWVKSIRRRKKKLTDQKRNKNEYLDEKNTYPNSIMLQQ